MKKQIFYPQNLDLERLLEGYDLSPTRRRNVTLKTLKMVSILFITNYNSHRFNEKGYTTFSSRFKKKLLNNDYKLVHDLLTKGPDPILEINVQYKVGKSCKLHRLVYKYRTSVPSRIVIHQQQNSESSSSFLDDQFTQNVLTLDIRVYELLFNLYNELDSGTKTGIEKVLLKNYIGRNLNIIDDIDNGIYLNNQSRTNLRYNSTITSLNKVVRPFLLCNGHTLSIVDIKSSQPYILASILNNQFLKSKDVGYNIKTIYPHIPASILFPRFLKGKGAGIEKFRQSPFHQDFYSYVLLKELGRESTKEERDKLKYKTMQFLFFNNSTARDDGEIGYLKRQFPSIDAVITQFLNIIGKRRFAYLLQRTESYLVLDKVCKEFHLRYPEAPFFTIHDAVMTTVDYSKELNAIMYHQLYSSTGIVPGLKIEPPILDIFPSDYSINRVKNKILKRSKEIKHIDEAVEVLDINIKKTDELIHKMSKKENHILEFEILKYNHKKNDCEEKNI